MDDILADLQRRVANMVRRGVISDVNLAGPRPACRVKLGDNVTDWLLVCQWGASQYRESDAALLTRLAKQYNAVSKPSGGYWLFLVQGEGTSVSGEPLPSVTITPDMVSRWNYGEGERDGASAGQKTGKVGVNYHDKATGETKMVEVGHPGGADKQHPYTQSDKESAKASAKSKITQMKRKSRTMKITLPARLSLLTVTAKSRVTTQGFGLQEDQPWLTESMTYSLNSSGMSVDFSLVTDIKTSTGK